MILFHDESEKRFWVLVGLWAYSMLNLALVFCWFKFFLDAYGTPEKAIIIYFNNYGEANLELVIFIGYFLINCVGVLITGYALHRCTVHN